MALLLTLLLAAPARAELSVRDIVDRANKSLRGDSSHGTVVMTITTPSWERKVEIEGWNKGRRMAFIVVHSPPKEKGNTTLRRENEMWLWMAKVERVIKIPPTMMHAAWQGSDFTYEDIVKADSILADYEHRQLEKKVEPVAADEAKALGLSQARRAVHLIECLPKASAAVVWGRVLFTAAVYDDGLVVPLKEEDYSERGELVRTIELSKVERVRDRLVPMRLECRPTRKPGQKTVLLYRGLEFDVRISDSFFSLARLQRGMK
ncbi:MAG: outer membrane lipoprotein-sorting protein [Elusimicrobia bacterium]|nr:outer membrane lipoprotein-sorting protein [Elusimicrobiota bacterium]